MMKRLAVSPHAHPLVARVARFQAERDWTDGELARQVPMPRSTWTLLRRGARQPGRLTLTRLAAAFSDIDLTSYLVAAGGHNSDQLAARSVGERRQ
jgi:transcriptional regulator with XRE-family HTH domain